MDRPPFRLPDLPSDLPADLPGLPHTGNGPVFREPWEAQAFAMAVKLHETGAFTWPEWAAALAREIEAAQAAGDPDTGENYYRHWLAALERLAGEDRKSTRLNTSQSCAHRKP